MQDPVGQPDGQRQGLMPSPEWSGGWWCGAAPRPSPFFNARPVGPAGAVKLVVVHSISLPAGVYGGTEVEDLFLGRLDPRGDPALEAVADLEVSAHFFIRRTGDVLQFVSCDARAWHAGVSVWDGRERCNDFSIGIEFEGLPGLGFEAVQYAQGAMLLDAIAMQYPVTAVAGHEHVAPGRKTDPGAGFDWVALRAAADGVVRQWQWPTAPTSPAASAPWPFPATMAARDPRGVQQGPLSVHTPPIVP